ncbi:sigma-70 family RNA polymerase sigma factor [Wenyingzhuangia sp. 1_MG-2023]|nr:sigma-70 family RNA polymerase sigma factor [Wenyingzhuangia sp. 1_MG-2023]
MKKKLNFHNILKSKSSSEKLWGLFIDGDMDAFKTIYNMYYQMLYNFGKRYLNDSEVEDAIHDTFLNILKYKNSSSEVKNIKAYLFKCLRNQIFKVKKAAKLEFELDNETIQSENNTHEEQEKELVFKKLKELIKELSPREREIIYLKYFQNFNNIEISELLDLNYQTVRNILGNAIKKLRILGGDQLL